VVPGCRTEDARIKPIAAAIPDKVRETLLLLARKHGVALTTVSRPLGQDVGYLTGLESGRGPRRL
jgi:hypothetical protein